MRHISVLVAALMLSFGVQAAEGGIAVGSMGSEPCPVKHKDICHQVAKDCVYQGQHYTEGALLKMEGKLFQCQVPSVFDEGKEKSASAVWVRAIDKN